MTSKIWGGRFSGGPADIMEEINSSISFDKRLAEQDLRGSQAHCAMLIAQKLVSQEDGDTIMAGLKDIEKEISEGTFSFKRSLEDIHMHVETRLGELIGEPAGRLHTARSRNDQVATDLRMWVRTAIDTIDNRIKILQSVLIDKAEEHSGTIMPGFTHLQTAQPVTLGHHFMAYVEMLGRDRGRLKDTRARLNECPLGAAALAGTSLPIDRSMTAKQLDFDQPMKNSIDAVSDRDFTLEFVAAGSIVAIHLSRLAEEIVIWASSQFGFLQLSDAYSTGSSMMPQKRNPDAAELIRAKSGRIFGALLTLLTVMKGLPLTYSKDLQEDKEPVFAVLDTLELCLGAITGMIQDVAFDRVRLKEAASEGYSTATDLADWLVNNLNMAFRDAHHLCGRIVRMAEDRGCRLEELELVDLQSIEARITEDTRKVLSVDASVASRTSFGGTAPDNVLSQVALARKKYIQGNT